MFQNLSIEEIIAVGTAIIAVFGVVWRYFFPKQPTSDITISSLSDTGRLRGVHGVEPYPSEEYQTAIYPEGVRAAFLLTHNRTSNIPITLTVINLDIERVAQRKPNLSKWLIDASKRPPAGLGKADVFKLTLVGEEIETAYWNKQRLNTRNFLELADGSEYFRFDLMPDEAPRELLFDIRSIEAGLYRIRFMFTYFIAGQERTKTSESILIYMEE